MDKIALRSTTFNSIHMSSIIDLGFGDFIVLNEIIRINRRGRIISIDRIAIRVCNNGKIHEIKSYNHSDFYDKTSRKIIMKHLSTYDRLTIKNIMI